MWLAAVVFSRTQGCWWMYFKVDSLQSAPMHKHHPCLIWVPFSPFRLDLPVDNTCPMFGLVISSLKSRAGTLTRCWGLFKSCPKISMLPGCSVKGLSQNGSRKATMGQFKYVYFSCFANDAISACAKFVESCPKLLNSSQNIKSLTALFYLCPSEHQPYPDEISSKSAIFS